MLKKIVAVLVSLLFMFSYMQPALAAGGTTDNVVSDAVVTSTNNSIDQSRNITVSSGSSWSISNCGVEIVMGNSQNTADHVVMSDQVSGSIKVEKPDGDNSTISPSTNTWSVANYGVFDKFSVSGTAEVNRTSTSYTRTYKVVLACTSENDVNTFSNGKDSDFFNINVTILPDSTAPTSSITAPEDDAVFKVGDTVTISGTASDPAGIASVAVSVSPTNGSITSVTGTTAWSATWVPSAAGTYTISSVARDNSGNLQSPPASVTVIVENQAPPADTTPPTITAPADKTAEATGEFTQVDIGWASASDNSGSVTVTSDAPAAFPLGKTTVTWAAADPTGNTATATQIVTIVDTTKPVFTFVPADVRKEATAVDTPVDIGLATATDIFLKSVTSDAPAAFPLGPTTVTWTAVDTTGNTATATQTVTIVDTTAPVITAPADVTTEATAFDTPKSDVDLGTATASDIFLESVTSDAPATFHLGATVVTWTAVDTSGNTATATQTVTIVDTTAPVITAPADVTTEATAFDTPKSDVDLGTATATDLFPVTITNNAPETFPLGDTTVTWTAEDTSHNKSTVTQKVTIVDTTAPVFTHVPGPVTALLGQPIVLGQATATDIFLASVTNNAPSVFPLGTTTVTWTATDTSGNVATATQIVTVKYGFGNVLQPINTDGSSVFKAGSTVPVKFQLKDYQGNFIPTATAWIKYAKLSDSVYGDDVEAVSTSAATTGNYFRYDTVAKQYIFNLSTKGLTAGTYRLTVYLDDGMSYSVTIGLK